MEAHNEQEVNWGWLLATFLVLVGMLFLFGDVLTGIVGTLIIGAIFAGYYNDLHKEY